MKYRYLPILLVTFLMQACAPSLTFLPSQSSSTKTLDFRPYAAKGFLFSEQALTEKHETLGVIHLRFTPEITPHFTDKEEREKKQLEDAKEHHSVHYIPVVNKHGFILAKEDFNMKDVVKKIYYAALRLGGDGCVNLKITKGTEEGYFRGYPIAYNTLEVSGIVVKRDKQEDNKTSSVK